MDPVREEEGSILLPDVVQGRLRPDSGLVCGIGGARTLQSGERGEECHLTLGQRVLVRPYQGMWDPHESPQVRYYGLAYSHGLPQLVEWWDDVVAFYSEGQWWPTGGNLLVRREKDVNPLVPDELQGWLDTAEVVAQGDYVGEPMVGRRIAFKEGHKEDVLEFAFAGWDDSVCLVPSYCVMVMC